MQRMLEITDHNKMENNSYGTFFFLKKDNMKHLDFKDQKMRHISKFVGEKVEASIIVSWHLSSDFDTL